MKKRGVRVDAPLDFSLLYGIRNFHSPGAMPVDGDFDINFDIIFLVFYSLNYVFLCRTIYFSIKSKMISQN